MTWYFSIFSGDDGRRFELSECSLRLILILFFVIQYTVIQYPCYCMQTIIFSVALTIFLLKSAFLTDWLYLHKYRQYTKHNLTDNNCNVQGSKEWNSLTQSFLFCLILSLSFYRRSWTMVTLFLVCFNHTVNTNLACPERLRRYVSYLQLTAGFTPFE